MAAVVNEGGEDGEGGAGGEVEHLKLPVIDLRLFTQDELLRMAVFSGNFPESKFHDLVIPKIDKAIFNESAGSRRQTYGKTAIWWNKQLGREDSGGVAGAANVQVKSGGGGVGVESLGRQLVGSGRRGRPRKVQASIVERSRGVKAVARAFIEGKRSSRAREDARRDGKRKVENNVSFRVQSNLSARGLWDRSNKRRRSSAAEHRDNAGDLSSEHGKDSISRRNLRLSNEPSDYATLKGANWTSQLRKRTRINSDDGAAGLDGAEAIRANKLSRQGGSESFDKGLDTEIVNGQEGRVIRKGVRDVGVKKPGGRKEMFERLAKMKGKWASTKMSRKIVDAAGFPKGWTVCIGLRHKDGRTFYEYRDWRSPEGQLWISFKDAAAYLVSTLGKDPNINEVSTIIPSQADSVGLNSTENAKKEVADNAVCKVCGEVFPSSASLVTHVHSDGIHDSANAPSRDVLRSSVVTGLRRLVNSRSKHQFYDNHVGKFTRVSPRAGEVEIRPQAKEDLFRSNVDLVSVRVNSEKPPMAVQAIHRRSKSSCKSSFIVKCKESSDNIPNQLILTTSIPQSGDGSIHQADPNCLSSSIQGKWNKCSLCGMIFSNLSSLRRHLRRDNHSRSFKCDVCEKNFSSKTLLLGHRVRMVHARGTKGGVEFAGFQSDGSQPVARLTTSGLSSIVYGLLSDHAGFSVWNTNRPSILRQRTKRAAVSPKNVTSLRQASKKIRKEMESGIGRNLNVSSVFECGICHRAFHQRAKFRDHLNSHAKDRKKPAAATDRSQRRSITRVLSALLDGRKSGRKSMVGQVVSGSTWEDTRSKEVSYTKQPMSGSVFWRLLNDSAPEGTCHERMESMDDATVKPLARFSKEEGADTEGSMDVQTTRDVRLEPTSSVAQRPPISQPVQVRTSMQVVTGHNTGIREQGKLNGTLGKGLNGFPRPSCPTQVWRIIASNDDRCPVCNIDGDRTQLLVCDWCDREYHLDCVKLNVGVTSTSDWICPICEEREVSDC